MTTFLDALHVLSAVLLVGPLMVAPFVGRRAIQRRSADGVRVAANQMNVYGLGSILTALLGFATMSSSARYSFRDPWIIVSTTLYVVALGVVFVYVVPALRKAARMVEAGVLIRPEEEDPAQPVSLTATGTDLKTKEELDALTGRVSGAGLLVLLVFAIITMLMTIRPF
ncbi:putative membrane protein [Allocatelliglobosispora scoriae]|uniref:Putative membrane protein n=1 Tax=Allocatelliglobosispora scoriae TaxID=643052 RepID=A0A841BSF8_9ACTN|nr:DUF2269 family protein [Allocatelliglobosispora scoriae]MBB5870338.1 putative membrane protein [Allocatelliglobosispora scoriae]